MTWQFFRLVYGIIPGFIMAALRHPVAFIRAGREAKRRAAELMPARHRLPYEIPTYREGMPYCKSKEKYLRPTYQCESTSPEIVAMANKLGAYQKSDREYVEACFDFVKRNIEFSLFYQLGGAVKTLRSGKGICLDNVSLFIAICRAGGIPSRYKIYNEAFVTHVYELVIADSPVARDWYNSIGHFVIHSSAEVLVDEKWLLAEFVVPPELEAGLGLPLTYLGEDASGTWCYRVPGSTVWFEGLTRGVVVGTNLTMKMLEGIFMGIELRLREKIKDGKRVLAELGEAEYNRRARETYKAILPEVSKKLFQALEMVDDERL